MMMILIMMVMMMMMLMMLMSFCFFSIDHLRVTVTLGRGMDSHRQG